MRKVHVTAKGTELPLMDMKGKDYLEVPYRVLWMREEHPDWAIETEFLHLSPEEAVAKATIRDGAGKVIAQGTKRCTPAMFKLGFIEKAETGAVGRALGFSGYGTQFALDLDEPDDEGKPNPVVAEAPIAKPVPLKAVPSGAGGFIMTFGKFTGKRLDELDVYELDSYLRFLKGAERKTPTGDRAIEAIDEYLKTREYPRDAKERK